MKITRRQILYTSGFCAYDIIFNSSVFSQDRRPLAGAIRWDAWYDSVGKIALEVQRNLSPPEFQYRIPFFGDIAEDGSITISGNNQHVIDKEIHIASEMNLDYWAYCWYPNNSPMQNAWILHQKSKFRNLMNWCMIWQFSNLHGPTELAEQTAQYIGYFLQNNYMKLKNDRPLLYIYIDQIQTLASNWRSDWSLFAVSLSQMRATAEQAGLKSPYIVIMHGSVATASGIARQVGGDAISNYMARVPNKKGAKYSELDKSVKNYWTEMATSGVPVVPIAMTGWDTRPRQYQKQLRNAPYALSLDLNYEKFVVPGSRTEISNHLLAARSFVQQHPTQCEANTYLIYSWNECDEGGGLLCSRQ